MELMEKQGYKQTEVGLIPEDWSIRNLREVGDAKMCKRIFSYQTSERGDIPFYKIGTFGKEPDAFISSEIYNDFKKKFSYPKKGSILISAAGTVGRTVVFNGEDSYFQDSNIVWIDNDEKILTNEYLKHAFPKIRFRTEGGTIQRLYNNILLSGFFTLPPTLEEQKVIATALSDVDELITNLDKLITKKKALKQGAMQQLLSGKTRLKGFGLGFGYKDSDLGLIPEDWDVKLLPEVFDYIHGKAHEQHINEYGQYTVVNSKFVSSEGKVSKCSSENFCKAKIGDILTVLSDLPNGKALAKTYYVEQNDKYAVNQRVCVWRAKKDDSMFLNYIMNRNKYFLKLDDGVTQTHILNHHIEKCPILIPKNIEEQKAIGEILSDLDIEIEQIELKKEKYQSVKQGMMQELLTGKTRLV
jgi:type I restriction enzyme S subunit